MAPDHPFYDIFAQQKVLLLKISGDVIAYNFRFGLPSQSKILDTFVAEAPLAPLVVPLVRTTHKNRSFDYLF